MSNATPEVPASVSAFLEKQMVLPNLDAPQIMPPRFVTSKVGCFLWNKVFSWIGFPYVKFHEAKMEDGKPAYMLEWVVFGITTHYAIVTPFMAHSMGYLIWSFRNHGLKKDFGYETAAGILYIPQWSVKEVLKHFAYICETNKKELKFLREELRRLAEEADKNNEVVPTTQDLLAAGKEPTLH